MKHPPQGLESACPAAGGAAAAGAGARRPECRPAPTSPRSPRSSPPPCPCRPPSAPSTTTSPSCAATSRWWCSGRRGAARVAVVPAWQGRVMTSTAAGRPRPSYGWTNDELVASGAANARTSTPSAARTGFWLGPEGGQFSIFFQKGDPFDLEHWQTPPLVDTERLARRGEERPARRLPPGGPPRQLLGHGSRRADRPDGPPPRRRGRGAAARRARARRRPMGRLRVGEPAHERRQAARGRRRTASSRSGSSACSSRRPATTVVVPYREGPETELGPVVNDAYFGKVPADRLVAQGRPPLLQRRRPLPEQDRPLAAPRAPRPRQLRRRAAGS